MIIVLNIDIIVENIVLLYLNVFVIQLEHFFVILKELQDDFHIHIYVENSTLYPKSVLLKKK